jgi:hypothetical protein
VIGRRGQATAQAAHEAEAGIRDLEGHLLWAAQIADARVAAQEFAARCAWATTDERADLARLYADRRLDDSREMTDRIAERARGLQAQYEHRWREVKSRLVLGVLLTVAAVIFTSALLFALR